MIDLCPDLLGCLDLRVLPPEDSAPGGFEGRNQQLEYHRLFGGQLLAQFARAAALACPGQGRQVHARPVPRAGRREETVRFEVERHHEGGAFATLAILARQAPDVIATASVSMHAEEDGPSLQAVAPVSPVLAAEHRVDMHLIPWETPSAADLDSPGSAPPELELWMRTPPADPELAPALTAYATDLSLIGTAVRPLEGVSQRDAGAAFTSAVTSHTLWFHRPFRTDGWLLLRQHSPVLAHGRCFGRGDVLTEDGVLVASYAQEALVRFRR